MPATKAQAEAQASQGDPAAGEKRPLRPAKVDRSRLEDILDRSSRRHVHLDMMRVLCVFLVAIDHGDPEYARWNVLFSQCWVLQLLWMIAGISWSLTERPLHTYIWRLATYLVLGSAFNWASMVVAHIDWKNNLFDVVFQMWFVVGLIAFCTLTAHLKKSLKRSREVLLQPPGSVDERPSNWTRHLPEFMQMPATYKDPHVAHKMVVLIGGVLIVVYIMHLLFTQPIRAIFKLLQGTMGKGAMYWTADLDYKSVTGQLGLSMGLLWLAYTGPLLFREPGFIPWMLILYVYINRIFVIPYVYGVLKIDRILVGFELFVVGLGASFLGMKDRPKLKLLIPRFWFVLPFVGAYLWDCNWYGRFDEDPPTNPSMMLRWKVGEAMCMVTFLVAGEAFFDSRISTDGEGRWLTNWALITYLVHKGIHNAVPVPFNWVALALTVPIVYWATAWQDNGRSPRRRDAP